MKNCTKSKQGEMTQVISDDEEDSYNFHDQFADFDDYAHEEAAAMPTLTDKQIAEAMDNPNGIMSKKQAKMERQRLEAIKAEKEMRKRLNQPNPQKRKKKKKAATTTTKVTLVPISTAVEQIDDVELDVVIKTLQQDYPKRPDLQLKKVTEYFEDRFKYVETSAMINGLGMCVCVCLRAGGSRKKRKEREGSASHLTSFSSCFLVFFFSLENRTIESPLCFLENSTKKIL
eukprot:TRINITY_DN3252_c0_g1_i10.p1 TRINITY_DN3252_c0_g1~~TRINITY_DN3252_c0_g1_i10.p1  ORF type:complete len:230 (-),score=65.34 TRINITY_DN3252_c0_g1_i10:155-844(-)